MSANSGGGAGETPVPLNKDLFLRSMLRALTGVLEDVVGLDEAEGYVSVVGRELGREIGHDYTAAFAVERLDRAQLARVLVDLKARLDGDFSVVEETEDRIVFHNTRCPFGRKVENRESLCMMTSNVFGVIASESQGYAKVTLERTIARGDGHCHVVVHLRPGAAEGREYFRRDDAAHG